MSLPPNREYIFGVKMTAGVAVSKDTRDFPDVAKELAEFYREARPVGDPRRPGTGFVAAVYVNRNCEANLEAHYDINVSLNSILAFGNFTGGELCLGLNEHERVVDVRPFRRDPSDPMVDFDASECHRAKLWEGERTVVSSFRRADIKLRRAHR